MRVCVCVCAIYTDSQHGASLYKFWFLYTIIEYVVFVVERIETHSNYNTMFIHTYTTWRLRGKLIMCLCYDCHTIVHYVAIVIECVTTQKLTYDIIPFIYTHTYDIIRFINIYIRHYTVNKYIHTTRQKLCKMCSRRRRRRRRNETMTVCQRIFPTPQNITFIVVSRKANFDGLLGMHYVVL